MINRVVLVGRLTKDIELKKTGTGLSVASFTVACNRRQSQGNQQADFINCVAWRQTADFLAQYAKKGALVGVEGRISTRNYEANDGRKVYVTEVVCDSCQLLESRATREQHAGNYQANNTSDFGNYSTNNYQANDNFGFNQSLKNDNQSKFDDYDNGPQLDISSDDLPF